MTPEQARRAVLDALAEIAPDCDPDALDPTRPIRDQVEIDSMDQLNVMIAISEATGVEIPEHDYEAVATLDALVAYVLGRESR